MIQPVWAQETINNIIPDRPATFQLVNDYVGILPPAERQQLEDKLRAYNDSTSTQVAIVIVKTTQPYPIGDFALEVGRKWGVGQKDKNNGIVLAWATEDRKIFLATGYGLEGAIPDAIANQIVDNVLVPAFKEQRYYDGLDAATTEIIQRASGEYKADSNPDGEVPPKSELPVLLVFIALLIGVLLKKHKSNAGDSSSSSTYDSSDSSSSSSDSSSSFGGGSFGGGGAGGSY